MSFLRRHRYIIEEALNTVRRTPGLALITVTSLIFSLFILVIFIITGLSLTSVIESYKEHARVIVYLKEPITIPAFTVLQEEFMRNGNVREVAYISREQAMDKLKSEWGKDNPIFQALPDNPLPASIEVNLNKGAVEIDSVIEIARKVPGVDEIQYGQKTFDKLLKISRAVRTGFLLFGTILCFIVMLIVANTIKLTIVARKDEIDIMKLVGADDWFVRGPFICEGIGYGLIGGMVTVALVKLFMTYINREFGILAYLPFLETGSSAWMVYIVGLGVAIGFIGAFVSIVRIEDNEE